MEGLEKIDKRMGFVSKDLHSYAYSVGEAFIKKEKIL